MVKIGFKIHKELNFTLVSCQHWNNVEYIQGIFVIKKSVLCLVLVQVDFLYFDMRYPALEGNSLFLGTNISVICIVLSYQITFILKNNPWNEMSMFKKVGFGI